MITREQFEELMATRAARGIYPHEGDRDFFAKPMKSQLRPREYHVRRSIATDYYEFISGSTNPDDYVSIVSRKHFTAIVLPLDEGNMGGFVNSDEYANFRMHKAEKWFETAVQGERAVWEKRQ